MTGHEPIRGPLDATGAVAAVREAGEGAATPKDAVAARQARAAAPDVVAALAALPEGSPGLQRARADLRALGVSGRSLDASLRWWRAQRPRRAPAGGGADDRPVVRLGAELHIDVAAGIAALAADPDLYARSGALVRVGKGDAGEPIIRKHTTATMRARLTKFARWEKVGEGGDVEACIPPDAVTLGILEAGEWEGIRPLVGIVESPTLRPDCTVSQRPGYDPETKTLYLPTIDFPPVPEDPTRDDAARELLYAWAETSYDFPARGLGYADPSSLEADPDGVHRFLAARECPDAWGVVSAIASALARPAVQGNVPAHVFTAPTPGSGKGLQIDVVSAVVLGRVTEKFTWPAAGERSQVDAEVEKRLAGALIDPSPLLIWDELQPTVPFGGPSINNALTCGGRMKIRIIGTPNTPALPFASVMLGAGNNVTIRDNTHRRMLLMHIESPLENPEERTGWRRDPLIPSILERRARIVTAILTVLVAYDRAGRPDVDGCKTWGGGFEDWSNLVARAIRWAGGGNVLGCRPSPGEGAGNEERDAVSVVLDAIARLEPKDDAGAPTHAGITMGGLIDVLYTRERLKGEAPPDGYDDARETIDAMTGTAAGRKPQAKRLSDAIRAWKRRPVGDRMLDVAAKKDRANVQRWTVRRIGR